MDYCALARRSLEHWLQTQSRLTVRERADVRAGCFVTLTEASGNLRGCIGTIEPVREDLVLEIIDNAVSAGMRDPRFPAVSLAELAGLHLEVSVLQPPEPVASMDQLDPVRYGVVVTIGFRRGVLLPDLDGVNSVAHQLAIAKRKAHIGDDETVAISRFEVIKHVEQPDG